MTILRRRTLSLALVAALGSTTLAGCQDMQNNPKQTGGAVLGGLGGGLLGSTIGKGSGNTAAIIGGTLIGALVGSEVGKSLDRADKLQMERSTQTALETAPSGRATSWNNPDSGHSGTITPTSTFYRGDLPCREFTSMVTIDGKNQPAKGTACRQSDGTWRLSE